MPAPAMPGGWPFKWFGGGNAPPDHFFRRPAVKLFRAAIPEQDASL